MKIADNAVRIIDKSLQRFDPIWRAQNGVGGQRDRYYDKTGVQKYREWRGLKDTMADYVSWLKILGYVGKMVAATPVHFVKGLLEYRWLGSYLSAFNFVDRLCEGYRGPELEAAHIEMQGLVKGLTEMIATLLKNDRRLGGSAGSDLILPYDKEMAPLWLKGFKELTPMPVQAITSFAICFMDQHIAPYYIDVSESFGIAPDVCSLCSGDLGVMLDDAEPIVGKALLSTNMACNGNEARTGFAYYRSEVPTHMVTFAMQHNEEEALAYSMQSIRDAMAFVEEQYGIRYDWEEFYTYAENMNEQTRIKHEKWEYYATPHSPVSGFTELLYMMFAWQLMNGTRFDFTTTDRKVLELCKKCYEEKHLQMDGRARHRSLLWGPSSVYYADLSTWLRNCWGISCLFGLEGTMGIDHIDTSSPEAALRDITRHTEKSVMRNVGVGGWDNIKSLFDWAFRFNCDMVLVFDNMSCKGMNGCHALIEEHGIELGFKFLYIHEDMYDHRTVSRQEIRNQINEYMSVVLQEEPLDPTILEFDDSEAY